MIRSPFPLQKKIRTPDIQGGLNDLLGIKKTLEELQNFKEEAKREHQARIDAMDKHIESAHQHLKRAEKIQKGDKGEPGRTGDKGDSIKGDTPPVSEVAAALKPHVIEALKQHIPAPIKGEDGKPGVNAEPLDPIKVVELIKEKNLLKVEHIGGFERKIAEVRSAVMRGGGDTVAAGTNVTISVINGVKTISSSGGSSTTKVRDEIPSGSGTAFTLAHTPVASTLQLFRGGARQQVGAGNDYTVSGTAITLAITLQSNEILLADYEY